MLRASLVVLSTALATPAVATQFPENIGWRLEAQPWVAYESNPFRFSDANSDLKESDVITGTLLRGALNVPLLSTRTRLDLSGTAGHARYDRYHQLSHNPARFDGVLRWHATDLVSGSVSHRYGTGLYYALNRTYPDRDMITRRQTRADVNLHVTPSLVLPRIAVWQEDVGYEYAQHQMLFGRSSKHLEVSGAWSGTGRSVVSMGWQHGDGHYDNRTEIWREALGKKFADDSYFVDMQWDYSAKTQLAARFGYQQRRYTGLAGRDTGQWVARVRAGWDTTDKTRFDVIAWHQAYPNEEDPAILYATVTGGRLSMRWHPTVKTMFSLAAAYELKEDTLVLGQDTPQNRLMRFGPRFEWQWHRSMRLYVDAWHDRTAGPTAGSSYSNTTVRAGLMIQLGNRWEPPPGAMWQSECDSPRYIETPMCQGQ